MVKKKGKNAKPKEAVSPPTATPPTATPPAASEASSSAEVDKHGSEASSVTSHHGGDQGQGPSGRNQGQGRGRGEGNGRKRGGGNEGRGRGRGTEGEQPSFPGLGRAEGGRELGGSGEPHATPSQQQKQSSPKPQTALGGSGEPHATPSQQQKQWPPKPQTGPWKKVQETSPPANVVTPQVAAIPAPATRQDPTPAEGPRSFQATSPSPKPSLEAIPSVAAGDQKLISMKKGLADMSVSGDKKTAGVQSRALQIPHRKDYSKCGTSGRKSKILTNHLELNLTALAKTTVYHYDVSIEPDKPKRLMRRAVEAAKKELFPNRFPAFDGKKNLYTSGPLQLKNGGKADVKVYDDERDRPKDYVVTIKHVALIDMSSLTNYMRTSKQVPQTAIQALDVILRCAPAYKMVQVGRSFFSPPKGEVRDLGNGLEVWHGVFQSAIIGWKPFVNIDVAHKGFPKAQNCVKLIDDLADRFNKPNLAQGLNNFERDSLMRFLRELKVNYEVPGDMNSKRVFRVNGIGLSAREQRFKMDDGAELSVEQYYAQNKRCPLRFPNLPVLDVGSQTRLKKIYIPLELCTVKPGQVVIKRMNELQTANMIKIAATSSDDRKKKIMDALGTIDFNSDPCVAKEFKLSVSKDFEVVDSRVLDPPSLMYAQNKTVTPQKGVWFAGQFLEGKALARWTILCLARSINAQNLYNFADQMQRQGRKAGMEIAPPMEPFIFEQVGRRPVDDVRILEKVFRGYKEKKMELVFCVVEDKGDSYAQVKRMAELTVGVLTQCVKAVTIQRRMGSPATADNILMKVNSKLNGKNHSFSTMSRPSCLSVPVMIVGADVTHPPPDQTTTPSVAAVCASHDPKAFQYNLQYRLQPPRMEIIEDLQAIMREQLMFFYAKNRLKPQKIIFYRDGVSEGQFDEVLNVEFQAIRRACTSLQKDYQPGITFLVVQKRHHTRFFPDPRNKNPADHDGRNNNVPAGTIVDTMITHPTDMDFYLVSHASIQGVSRPTKYRRLWDDNDIPEDELELLTYYLCHMFSRCSRSVSYPAPTYNAHLAAYRVRCYLDNGHGGVPITKLKDEQERKKILDCILKDFPMFFV